MNTHDHRSPNLPRGYFRNLGLLHMHIDGGDSFGFLLPLLTELRNSSYPVKVTKVTSAVAGPQREEQPNTYEHHTPGERGNEQFSYFATIGLSDRKSAILTLNRLLPLLAASGSSNFVVEIERVIAVTEGENPWCSVPKLERPITAAEVLFTPGATLPIEIHHGFDVPAETDGNLSVGEVLKDVTQLGISVGGWFIFDREQELCFRSNAFTAQANYLAKAAKQHEMIGDYLRGKGVTFKLWTTAEQVLGIWNSRDIAFPQTPTNGESATVQYENGQP